MQKLISPPFLHLSLFLSFVFLFECFYEPNLLLTIGFDNFIHTNNTLCIMVTLTPTHTYLPLAHQSFLLPTNLFVPFMFLLLLCWFLSHWIWLEPRHLHELNLCSGAWWTQKRVHHEDNIFPFLRTLSTQRFNWCRLGDFSTVNWWWQ